MPETLKRLIDLIAFLPGIGEKTATKLAFFLLKANPAYLRNFARELEKLQTDVHECHECFSLTDSSRSLCAVCDDPMRDRTQLCIVEDYLDMLSLERLAIFHGLYHVLGGSISPIHGRLPEHLHFRELFDRIRRDDISEVIIAVNPNIEGEATAMYITENMPKNRAVGRGVSEKWWNSREKWAPEWDVHSKGTANEEAEFWTWSSHFAETPVKITRLSKGLPNAGYIEYADEITLINAFKGRG